MNESTAPKNRSKIGFWAIFCCISVLLGVLADSIGLWKMFQRAPNIEAEILENGLRDYLDKQK